MTKLTNKVFTREDCPEWAKYAAVNSSGCGFWFETRCNLSKIPNNIKHKYIGTFSGKGWQNSWIENPKFTQKYDGVYSANALRSISEEKLNIWIKENTKMIDRFLKMCKDAANRGEFELYFRYKAWMDPVYMKRYFKNLGFRLYFDSDGGCIKW